MSSQTPFKPPRQLKDVTNTQPMLVSSSSESTSSTEEYMQAETFEPGIESLVRDEVQLWLASHGSKLFALEASKFMAAESKRKNVRGIR